MHSGTSKQNPAGLAGDQGQPTHALSKGSCMSNNVQTFCPHCGNPIHEEIGAVSSPCGNFRICDHVVSINRKYVRFPPMQCTVLQMLATKWGRLVPFETIYFGLYSMNSETEQPPMDIVRVHIFNIRKRLAGTGFWVQNIRSHGYAIKKIEDMA